MESHSTKVFQHGIAACLYYKSAATVRAALRWGPGKRTLSSALLALGLHQQGDFARYHHVLSRAVWSSLAVSQVLLGLLVRHLAPATGPLCLGLDETIERRKGKRIAAKGVSGMGCALPGVTS